MEVETRVIPKYGARALVTRLRERNARLIRTKDGNSVFAITPDAGLAETLIQLGGRYVAGGNAGFQRGGNTVWDIWIHQIPVAGEMTIWEASKLAEEEAE